jgi:hypothetical protein
MGHDHGMVNFEMFVKEPAPTGSHVMFKTMTHQRMFNVLLGDFLSQPDGVFDLRAAHTKEKSHRNTYLAYLLDVCDDPRLNSDSAVLREPVQTFADWLNTDCVFPDIWLSSISEKLGVLRKAAKGHTFSLDDLSLDALKSEGMDFLDFRN